MSEHQKEEFVDGGDNYESNRMELLIEACVGKTELAEIVTTVLNIYKENHWPMALAEMEAEIRTIYSLNSDEGKRDVDNALMSRFCYSEIRR